SNTRQKSEVSNATSEASNTRRKLSNQTEAEIPITIEIHPWLKRKGEKTFTVEGKKTKYVGFQFIEPLKVNDCLMMAESMACKKLHYKETKTIFQEVKTNLTFGWHK